MVQTNLLRAMAAATTLYQLEQEQLRVDERQKEIRQQRRHWRKVLDNALHAIKGLNEDEFEEVQRYIVDLKAMESGSLPYNSIR